LKHYKFGEARGRYIGPAGDIQVYSEGLVRGESGFRKERHDHEHDGQLWFDYGPSTGGMLESVGISFLTPGELISETLVDPSFKKRTLVVKGKSVEDALLTVERINGFHAASHSIAYCSAVEDALGINTDAGTRSSRIVMLEMERVRSHLEVIKRLCEPAGFGVPHSQIGYIRERMSRLISSVSGHRYFFSANSIGSAAIDSKNLLGETEAIGAEFARVYDGLLQSKIFLNRLQNNGRNEDGQHLIGPAARACNRRIDARLDSPSMDYSGAEFEVPVAEEGDSFARFAVRSGEIMQSLSIIRNIAEGPEEEGREHDTGGSGEGAARVESPQGDLFYYVNVRDGILEDIRMLSPSMVNISSFEASMKGNIFTDFHFNWESYGIWISEAGVEFA